MIAAADGLPQGAKCSFAWSRRRCARPLSAPASPVPRSPHPSLLAGTHRAFPWAAPWVPALRNRTMRRPLSFASFVLVSCRRFAPRPLARAAYPYGACTGTPRSALSAGWRGSSFVCVRCVFVNPPIDSTKGRVVRAVRIILIVCATRRVSAAAAGVATETVTPNPYTTDPSPIDAPDASATATPRPPPPPNPPLNLPHSCTQLYTAVYSCRPTRVQRIVCSRGAPRQRLGAGGGVREGGAGEAGTGGGKRGGGMRGGGRGGGKGGGGVTSHVGALLV